MALARPLSLAGLAAAAALAAAAPASAAPAKHFFWAQGVAAPDPNALSNDLVYHGGGIGTAPIGVEVKPAVYLVYWGAEWAQGFKTSDSNGKSYSSTALQKYVNAFFSGVGGSAWAGVQTQYCRGVAIGATSCAGTAGAEYITNPKRQLKGTWVDSTPVPSDIVAAGLAENVVDDPIASEAQRAAAHFGYDPYATYIVLTPPRPIATGQPAYCGYHTQTTSVDGYGNPITLQYAFIPFLNADWPGVGTAGCGMHNVNATSNAFGNGVFDGYSIVTGHEYSEAVTDPDNFLANQDGWNDAQGSENGDKCAWIETQDISLGTHQFAVQPTWSNEAFDAGRDGCAVSR